LYRYIVVRHVALTQSRINLGCHDADADGWLTVGLYKLNSVYP
jgi:hypothetical protein